MQCRFAIQASSPRCVSVFDAEDETLFDAIQTVFPSNAEYALIVWNWVFIPISYKYDICLLVDDIIELVESMANARAGALAIEWPSNTFAATWNIEWQTEVVTVTAQWRHVLGETTALLATKPKIVVATGDFVSEWKRLLEVIGRALNAAGYTQDRFAPVKRLCDAIEKIDRYGSLYRD